MKRKIGKIKELRKEIADLLETLDIPLKDLETAEITTTKEGAQKANRLIKEMDRTLRDLLRSSGINLRRWGRGKAKTFNHLLNEVLLGETELEYSRDKLFRTVNLSSVDLLYKDLKLVEERQVFEDGRVRIRELSATVTEKILPGEKPLVAARRGLEEELGIRKIQGIRKTGTEEATLESPSFPDLTSKYYVNNYKTAISKSQFNPRGYIENNRIDGITAFFVWKKRGQE